MVLEMNDIKVIKTGGGIVENPMLLEQFIKDFSALDGPKILVHGGGVMASQLQRQLGQQPVMIDGRRVTDMDTLKQLVRKVLDILVRVGIFANLPLDIHHSGQ